MQAAEQRADLVVLWALGDADGPMANEVRIGVCKRRTFSSSVVYAMRQYRSRPVAHRCEVYIRGECAALRLKTAVTHRLREIGSEVDDPWYSAAFVIDGIVRELAVFERVPLLTIEEAREVEQQELLKIMEGTGV